MKRSAFLKTVLAILAAPFALKSEPKPLNGKIWGASRGNRRPPSFPTYEMYSDHFGNPHLMITSPSLNKGPAPYDGTIQDIDKDVFLKPADFSGEYTHAKKWAMDMWK